jgi:hypothetical protein
MSGPPIHESGLRISVEILGQKLQGGSKNMAKSIVLPAIIRFLTIMREKLHTVSSTGLYLLISGEQGRNNPTNHKHITCSIFWL